MEDALDREGKNPFNYFMSVQLHQKSYMWCNVYHGSEHGGLSLTPPSPKYYQKYRSFLSGILQTRFLDQLGLE